MAGSGRADARDRRQRLALGGAGRRPGRGQPDHLGPLRRFHRGRGPRWHCRRPDDDLETFPAQGGARLLLEADVDGDGTYEAGIGDTIPAGVPIQVRVEGDGVPAGLVRVRANGETIVNDVPLTAGATTMGVPPIAEDGWVRAELRFTPAQFQETFRCGLIPIVGELPCPADQQMAAMTSPIWIASTGEQEPSDPPTDQTPPAADDQTPPTTKPESPPATPAGAVGGKRPRIFPRHGVRDVRRGAAFRVARLQCGSEPCRVRVQRRARMRGVSVPTQVHARAPRTLAGGAKAPLKLRIRDRALPRLGDGIRHLRLRVRIRSDSGHAIRNLRIKVRGPRAR